MVNRKVRRGSIVLALYPFTDLSGTKARPAVVVTPDFLLPQIDNVLCLFISSKTLPLHIPHS
jgi:mRNA-degrading endonuclease toxin of MazEF toxin-antitoxin module